MMSVDEMKKKRFQYIHKLYELVEGNERDLFNRWKIGTILGFDRKLTENITNYLIGEGLIEQNRVDGSIRLLHRGVTEVENAISKPNEQTTYFPAVNFIMNSTITNSQIQQSNNGQSQTMVINENYNDLNKIIQLIENSRDNINISTQQKSELDMKLQEIKNEISSKSPNKSVISEGVDSIKRILEGVASNVIASGLLMMLGKTVIA